MTSVFTEVLKMSLSAAFLVGIVIGVRWCFRKVPKWIHCILWALVAVRLVFPSLPQSQLSMVPQPVSDGQAIVRVVEEMPRFTPDASPLPQDSPKPQPGVPEKEKAPAPALEETAKAKAPIPWMSILCGVWLTGIAVMGLYALISYLRILKKVGPCVDVGHGVFLCDYIDTPFLLGIHRPRICLPSYLTTETAAYVLAHERAHLARRDHWWKPIGFMLLSIHWFNPMIWVGYILLCRDIEMACDEAVVKTMGADDKKGYSHALLTCSIPRSTISICPLAFGEVSVKERIKSVLSYKKPALWLTLIGVTAVVLGAVFFLTDPQKKIPLEDVEYLETARYHAANDELTVIEYDKQFRPTREITYLKGREDFRKEYTYQRRGGQLTRTIVCTHAPAYSEPTSHIKSTEGVSIPQGKTVTLVYQETLDENDNVLESVLTADEEWVRTETATYNENGDPLTQTRETLHPASKLKEHRIKEETFTYDAQGNLVNRVTTSKGLEPSETTVWEDKWVLDENGAIILYQYYVDGELLTENQITPGENGQNTSVNRGFEDGKLTNEQTCIIDDDGRIISGTFTSTDGAFDGTYNTTWDEAQRSKTVVSTDKGVTYKSVFFYDERENLLSEYVVEEDCKLRKASNYIGTDSFKSTGIPEEIYKEGQPVTACLALNTCGPDDVVTINGPTYTRISQLPGGRNQKIQRSEELTVQDLSAMMLLDGANDAAVAVAEHVAGNQQSFVEQMNQWVAGLGCTDTKFANVHGITTENSWTTARDLVKILEAALKNETFHELFGTSLYTVPATNRSDTRELVTQNYMMDQRIIPNFYDERITGGMQGYVSTIGANLICTVEDRYIGVILGAERKFAENGWTVTQFGNFEEMVSLLEQGISGK